MGDCCSKDVSTDHGRGADNQVRWQKPKQDLLFKLLNIFETIVS